MRLGWATVTQSPIFFMVSPESQETRLVERIVARDSAAFAELFDLHSSVILGVLVRMLRRRETAEEVLQETFLQAWENADRFDGRRASVRGWLLVMARSRAIDRLRASRARAAREELRAKEDATVMAEREPAADTGLLAKERGRALVSALGGLPDEQRRCIELAFFEGLTHAELARRLDQPLGTVKSRIALGMNKLRRVLQ
ncbi:MAG: RNA polymerase sigma factor [Thermoanaerobaculia bacterium]